MSCCKGDKIWYYVVIFLRPAGGNSEARYYFVKDEDYFALGN